MATVESTREADRDLIEIYLHGVGHFGTDYGFVMGGVITLEQRPHRGDLPAQRHANPDDPTLHQRQRQRLRGIETGTHKQEEGPGNGYPDA